MVKRLLSILLACAVATFSATASLAQNNPAAAAGESKPVAVLSIASWDKLLSNVAMLGRLAGNPDLDKNIEEALKLFTQGQGLAGLDRNRPWGLTLTTDGLNFEPIIFLPINNQKQLTDALAPLIGEPLDVGKGVHELNLMGQKVYLKNQNSWTFVGMTPTSLGAAPADPTKHLGGLDKSYTLAVRFYVQNIPDVYRSLAVDQLRLGVQSGLTREPNETEEQFAVRRRSVEQQLAAMTTTINDLDQLTLGLSFDTVGKSMLVDFTTAAVAGSKMAQQLVSAQPASTDFAGFLVPGAAMSFNAAQTINKEDIEQLIANLQTAKSQVLDQVKAQLPADAAAKLDTQIVAEIFDAIRKTIETGRLDLGATVNLGEKNLSLVFGAFVADPAGFEASLKKLSAAPADPKFSGFKFDADKHQDVRFHTASIVVPKDEQISKVLGDKLDIAVGIGAKSLYLAIGTDCVNQAKQLIDKSKADGAKKLAPMQMNFAVLPILQFLAASGGDPQIKSLAAELAGAKGKDGLSIVAIPQPPTASTVRIEAQEAVLRLVVEGVRIAAGLGGPIMPPVGQ